MYLYRNRCPKKGISFRIRLVLFFLPKAVIHNSHIFFQTKTNAAKLPNIKAVQIPATHVFMYSNTFHFKPPCVHREKRHTGILHKVYKFSNKIFTVQPKAVRSHPDCSVGSCACFRLLWPTG